MIVAKAQQFERDFQYENAKKQERKESRQKRDARRGKRNVWSEKE